MSRTNFQELLDAGVHFGHLARKWNPKMAPYIFDQKNGIHVIDLRKTVVKIDEAAEEMKQLAKSGRKILFVATKKQAKDIVKEKATAVNMPSITERWAGGMLTNFPTIRKAVKKMSTIDKMKEDGTFDKLAKRERLQVDRQRAKLEKNLGSIRDMSRLPSALFIVDVQKEANAVKEANRLNIPVFAMVDTCCDPTPIDYVIPANDDAVNSIECIVDILCKAIQEGLEERKLEKDKEAAATDENAVKPAASRKLRARKGGKPAEEAAANFAASPWSAGMSSRHLSLDGLAGELASCRQDWKYDHIFSNPPYFESSLKAPDARRRAARHADTLSYRDIISFAAQRLTERGILSMILPSDAETSARRYAASWSLPLFRIVRVRTTPRHPVSRTVMEFSRPGTNGISGYPSSPVPAQPVAEMLTIRNEGGYSEEYRSLTSEFLFI